MQFLENDFEYFSEISAKSQKRELKVVITVFMSHNFMATQSCALGQVIGYLKALV